MAILNLFYKDKWNTYNFAVSGLTTYYLSESNWIKPSLNFTFWRLKIINYRKMKIKGALGEIIELSEAGNCIWYKIKTIISFRNWQLFINFMFNPESQLPTDSCALCWNKKGWTNFILGNFYAELIENDNFIWDCRAYTYETLTSGLGH